MRHQKDFDKIWYRYFDGKRCVYEIDGYRTNFSLDRNDP